MISSTRKLGLAMSLTALLSFVIYTGCFAAILFVNDPFVWTNLQQFIAYETSSVIWFKYVGMGSMIVYVCSFLIITLCVKESVTPDKKIFASVSSMFGTASCICVSVCYFVQITSTRLQIQAGNLDGLIQLTQSYNISAINGINMLGWTVFYGISSLALGFSFGSRKPANVLRIACMVNAVILFAGFIGYILNNYLILLFTMNLGLGSAGVFIIICLIKYFRDLRKDQT